MLLALAELMCFESPDRPPQQRRCLLVEEGSVAAKLHVAGHKFPEQLSLSSAKLALMQISRKNPLLGASSLGLADHIASSEVPLTSSVSRHHLHPSCTKFP